MTMLSQASAVLVAAALLSWRARIRSSSFGIGTAAVLAIAAILTFTALSSFWGSWQAFRSDRRANASTPAALAATSGGPSAGANVDFVEWLNGKLPAGAPFYISTNSSDPGTYQWLLYRLYPRVAIEDPSRAQWVVFLRVTPEGTGFHRRDFAHVFTFAPDLLLAERRP
jgi:hypothetical protein